MLPWLCQAKALLGKALAAKDISHALKANGVGMENGVVHIRIGKRRHLEIQKKTIVDVEVKGELQLDHLLSLLGSASESTGYVSVLDTGTLPAIRPCRARDSKTNTRM